METTILIYFSIEPKLLNSIKAMESVAQQQVGRDDTELDPNNYSLQNFMLYKTCQRFHLVGRYKHKMHFQVLKINQSEPLEINIREDPVVYT